MKHRAAPSAPEPLDPRLVLGAYAVGAFPMADARTADHVHWVEPRQRAVLPLDGFHLSGSLRKTIASGRFRVTADQAFEPMIALCAEAAADRPDTWINAQIEQVFVELHRMGFAHSIEVWHDRELVGGLYGLALGRAFFGESMVSRARDASKVALGWLVARLRVGGFSLLDCQFMTPHLASLGAVEVSAARYSGLLADALAGVLGDAEGEGAGAGDFFALDRPASPVAAATESAPASGKVIAQLLGQTS
ncbi:leucyl/phenylalanyl-tRNA--protein transferase [Sphingomonas aracearum]|uniref:Leucyl/phenylalanyl-tRNA--protein transferase n=1 Tax=Sphingomonas aracearum TaxID=2283317 RepID=A0A369W4I5_9SPHN|nr:leucyl/phenylalanyl-tRNA--protein transferase [Sphingomonas aracearum]RDE06971.1 leucyl/phenylalanyl-tRNA--protein transferase [Sphingomonas aracearum]